MNTLYFNYALEVEKTASISQAADNLYMTQPTLSKAIKDLENQLGTPIFRRTARGVYPTTKGKEFLKYARQIVAQMSEMESALKAKDDECQAFRLAIPRGSNISSAIGALVRSLNPDSEIHLDIHESGFLRTVQLVGEGQYPLGLVRFPVENSSHYMKKISDRHLPSQELELSRDMIIFSRNHPLAQHQEVTAADLAPYMELTLSENLSFCEAPAGQKELPDSTPIRRIVINDCAARFDLLLAIPDSYMWSPALPDDHLAALGLVQKSCSDSREYKTLLISHPDYCHTTLDQTFLSELFQTDLRCF